MTDAAPHLGSSPLARGLLQAYVQTTLSTGDHPRSRGVYAALEEAGARPDGSSPLARGLPTSPETAVVRMRIIPARAGFTRRGWRAASRGSDHPRSRGVYGAGLPLTVDKLGSSPLARGLQDLLEERLDHARIIPARAGFTRRSHHRMVGGGDHPRSRGVYTVVAPSGYQIGGSSPLARGLPPPMCLRTWA